MANEQYNSMNPGMGNSMDGYGPNVGGYNPENYSSQGNQAHAGMGQVPKMGQRPQLRKTPQHNQTAQGMGGDQGMQSPMGQGAYENQFNGFTGNPGNPGMGYENATQNVNKTPNYVGSPLDKKGKLGVSFVILGIIAWMMVAGQLTTGLIIFAILCMFIEKDEHLTKVMMSALEFAVASYLIISGWSVVYSVISYLVGGIASSSGWFSFIFELATKLQSGLVSLNGLVTRVYDIVVFVIGFKSAVSISKGQLTESKIINRLFHVQ